MLCHWKLGDYSGWEVTGQGPRGEGNYQHTKCTSCEFYKAQRHATRVHTLTKKTENEMDLKKQGLVSDERVSVDHYQSAFHERIQNSTDSTHEDSMYHCGSI